MNLSEKKKRDREKLTKLNEFWGQWQKVGSSSTCQNDPHICSTKAADQSEDMEVKKKGPYLNRPPDWLSSGEQELHQPPSSSLEIKTICSRNQN